MAVPCPMGFWARGLDGRIDDPNAGWKGRGVWSNTGNRTPFHIECGKENSPKVVHFQMRPDPLARGVRQTVGLAGRALQQHGKPGMSRPANVFTLGNVASEYAHLDGTASATTESA